MRVTALSYYDAALSTARSDGLRAVSTVETLHTLSELAAVRFGRADAVIP